ncbi:MAG TPA: hypothetical protein VHD56_18265 [Tepidisphaeraceae bacterium]|nr:hypothetical protein [Tepidisphaeraceae bacterium]
MLKWFRRILVGLAILLLMTAGLVIVGLRMMYRTPDWYHPQSLNAEQRLAAAQSATNKLAILQNGTAFARAEERAVRNGATRQSTAPGGITISFSDDELNALMSQWAVWKSVRAGYEKFLSEPYLVLQDGRLILAGKLPEIDTIASLHFEPTIDQDGRLNLKLARVLAGKLPLPQAAMSTYQKQAAQALSLRLPRWRQRASIDPTGLANSDAVSAVLGTLIMHAMNHESADPVVFMEVVSKGRVPVKLSRVEIGDHLLTLTVLPMTADERGELLRKIRETDIPKMK